MQREFINIAAHELRTPAQSVLGYAELMREDIMDKQDASRESIDAIHRNAKRLQRLTNNILDVSRIESQTLNLDKEVFDLNDLLSKIVEDYENRTPKDDRNLINKTRCALHLSYSRSRNNSSELIVEGDRDRINQAVSNLINNAIEFTSKKGGTISVTAEKRNVSSKDNQAEAVINVVDSGEGIHHEIIPRLFTKFASRSNSGTGLSLYISKSIVEAHGGRIWAENNSDAIGATFSFSLPISQNK
jgi:signal transduction histidine kinase